MHRVKGKTTPRATCDPSLMTEALGYRWTTTPLRIHQHLPLDWPPDGDEAQRLIETIIREAWPVAHLREQIRHLGMKPKGRRRADLARQYIYEGFVPRKTVQQRWAELSETERLALPYWLLAERLRLFSISLPDPFSIRHLTISFARLSHEMARAGMGVVSPDGEVFAPAPLLVNLPHLSIDVPTAEDAALPSPRLTDPYLPAIRLQALLEYLAGSKLPIPLRSHAEWRPMIQRIYSLPDWGWPPLPEEAEAIHQHHRLPEYLTLCPLPPHLTDDALRTWALHLGLDERGAEFFYHLLKTLTSPDEERLEITEAEVQQWKDIDPYRHPTRLLTAYQQIMRWAAWFPTWRQGHLTVRWDLVRRNTAEAATSIAFSGMRIRYALLSALAFFPHGTWITVQEATNILYGLFPNPTILLSNYLHIADAEAEHWMETLGRLLVAILRGPLYDLGLVDLHPDRETPTHFALFHLQDVTFARYEALRQVLETPLPADRFHFEAARKLLRLTLPIPPNIHHFLHRIASFHAIQPHTLLYKPDVARLHAAFESGESPATLAQTWQHLFGCDAPEALRQWWHQWWQRYGHIRLYPRQAILTTRDDFTMREIQTALPDLHHRITAQVSPRIALIDHEDAPAIVEQLQRAGYMPKLEA